MTIENWKEELAKKVNEKRMVLMSAGYVANDLPILFEEKEVELLIESLLTAQTTEMIEKLEGLKGNHERFSKCGCPNEETHNLVYEFEDQINSLIKDLSHSL